MKLDRYANTVLTLIRRRYAEWDANPPTATSIARPGAAHPLKRIGTVHGVQIPVEDEDWPTRTFAEKALHMLFRSPFYGLKDSATPWKDGASAEATLREVFGERLIPPEAVHWDDLSSDAAQSRFAFAGLGASHLARTDAPDASFVVDMTWMADLSVRAGFERYGAAAWFDESRAIVRITWSHGDRDVRPGEPDWEHAKFAWRSSVLVGITLADHLWGLHLRLGNEMVVATRECLPADHPIRLLLKPYCFRSVAINHRASAILVVERGLPHRAFALAYDGLAKGLIAGQERAKLLALPKELASRGVGDLTDFPYATDGLALYDAIEQYVRETVELYLPNDAVSTDTPLQEWWAALGDIRPDEGPLHSSEQLVEVLSAFAFAVVGLHKHVGALCEYVVNPENVSPRIRPGATCGDQQGSVLMLLLVAGTGLEQPKLMSDFSHLLPAHQTEEAKRILERYMSRLQSVSDAIRTRNTERPHPYRSFDPRRLECSVSI